MPHGFDGDTYVAFSDLSGFKKMQNRDRNRANRVLEQLFQTTRRALDNQNRLLEIDVDAIGISDCIVSWANDGKLNTLMWFLEPLHRQAIKKRYLLSTTIAYGDFRCHRLPGLSNLEVTFMAGKAYTLAYSENARAEPGMIVLIKTRGLPRPTGWRWHPTDDAKNYEFLWSARQHSHIQMIKQERAKARPMEKEGDTYYRRLPEIYQGKFKPRRPIKKSSKTEGERFNK